MENVLKSEKESFGIRLAQGIIHFFFILQCLSIVLVIALTLIVSFSAETSIIEKGYSFFPNAWSLDAYKSVFSDNEILQAYWVSIRVTLLGTFFALLISIMCAYVLSNKKLKYRNHIAFFIYLPTIASAGICPWYFLIKEVLNLENTLTVLWLPSLVNVFNILLIRNYMGQIPDAFAESAQLDGAGEYTILFRILLPLAKPIIATVSLFFALGYWNDYANATWFIDLNHKELYPLQYYLFRLWDKMRDPTVSGDIPFETTFVATMFVSIGPILIVYPFVQKFFVKGIVVGGVKG